MTSTVRPDHTAVFVEDGDDADGAALHKSNRLSLFEQRARRVAQVVEGG